MTPPSLPELVEEIFQRPPTEGISLAMVVLVEGQIVAERYGISPANNWAAEFTVDADTALTSWSMAKSVAHAAVGLLVGDGSLDLTAPAPIAEWAHTPKAAITTLDLLEMRPGLRFVEDYVDGEHSDCLEMLFGIGADDMATHAASLPLDHPPGTVWNYSSGTTNIVSRIIGNQIADGERRPAVRRAAIDAWLRECLFTPANMASATPLFDPAGNWVASSYLNATARDFANFGELYRLDGVVGDKRLLPAGWLDHGRTVVAHDPESDAYPNEIPGGTDYGRHWWVWPEFPGSIVASGYEGQLIVVIPDRALTVVHLGKTDVTARPSLYRRVYELVRSVPPSTGADR